MIAYVVNAAGGELPTPTGYDDVTPCHFDAEGRERYPILDRPLRDAAVKP